MGMLQKICNGMGLVSEWAVKVGLWLVLLLIVVITYDVIMRYVFNAPTNWAFCLSYMLGGIIAATGLAYVHYHNANVRVAIIYSRLSPKRKLIFDTLFSSIFLFPLFSLLTWIFWKDALYSYSIQELALESTWYPVLWPFKTLMAVGISLFWLLAIIMFVKDVLTLARSGRGDRNEH